MAGVYGRGLAQALVGSEAVYLVYEDGRVAASPLQSGASHFGSAPPTEAVFGGLNENNVYTYAGSFVNDVRPAAFAAVNDSFYLLLENDNRLYRFSGSDFELVDVTALHFIPSLLRSDGKSLYVAFDGADLLYDVSAGRYWSLPVPLDDFLVDGGQVYGISGGRACTFRLGDGAVRWVGGEGAVRLGAGRGDALRLRLGRAACVFDGRFCVHRTPPDAVGDAAGRVRRVRGGRTQGLPRVRPRAAIRLRQRRACVAGGFDHLRRRTLFRAGEKARRFVFHRFVVRALHRGAGLL